MSLRRLGNYELLVRLASGGAAHVLLARDVSAPSPGRLLALKVLQPSLAANPDFLQMFFTEARIAAHLHHPNVVGIAGFGRVDGVQCLALEYVFGASLADVLRASARAQRPMSVGVLLSLTASVCDALHYAHELTDQHGRPMGLVHRDVTPQNILIGFNGIPKLTDFGIAKATGRGWETQAGIVKGKFSYMSPEQATGKPVDRRSDVFGVGIVLWEALTGHDLFKGSTPAEVIGAIRDQSIAPPSHVVPGLTPIVDPIVLRALERAPRRRFPTARDMGDAIRQLIERAGVVIDAGSVSRELSEIYGDVIADRALALRAAMSGRPDLDRLARALGAHPVEDRLLPDLAAPRSEPGRRASEPRVPSTWEDTTEEGGPADELLGLLSTEDVTVGQLPPRFEQQVRGTTPPPGVDRFRTTVDRPDPLPLRADDASEETVDDDSTRSEALSPRAVASWEDGDSDAELDALSEPPPPPRPEPGVGAAYRPLVRAPGTDDPAPADSAEALTRAMPLPSDPGMRGSIPLSPVVLLAGGAALFVLGVGVGLWLAAG